jgi:hypothetical protein
MRTLGVDLAAGPAKTGACVVAAELTTRCGPLAEAAVATLTGCDDDALDAFICALVARAAALDLAGHPTDDDLPAARREGWIHLPTIDLDALVART